MIQPADQPQGSAPSPTPPGRVTRALLRWLMRSARVAAAETLSPHFRLIDLEGESLQTISWIVGQKIQIAMGSGLSARTYTPMSWDTGRGRIRILAFSHGGGPGSRWAIGLRDGDTCQLFGPRRSLDLSGVASPVILFGDETSFGLAAALRASQRGADAMHVFEVSDITESRLVLETIGLGQATLIARSNDDAHLAAAEAEMLRLAASGGDVVLTGKAPSIQRLSRALKINGVATSRLKTKAYWAPGKTGLD